MLNQFYIRGLDNFPLILLAKASLIHGTRPNTVGRGAGDLRALCFLAFVTLVLLSAQSMFTT